jgi:DNA modification methylase
MTKMQISNINLSKLKNNNGQIEGLPKNPRLIKDERFKKLVKSIKDDPEMLELRELLVYPLEDSFIVIGGNMRLKAMMELGYKEAPCKILDENTPLEKLKAYTIKDNVPFGENDWEILSNEWDLGELDDWGLEVPDLEIDEEEPEVEEDEVPEVKKDPFVKKGDVWELGEHRLVCGDSTLIDDVDKVMNGEKADLMITDLPYGVSYADKNNFLNNLDKGNKIQKEIKNDHIAPNELYDFAKNIYIPAYSIMNKKNSYYAFMPQGGEQMMMMMALKDSGFQVKHELIWLKNNHVLGRADYCYKHEPICYGWTDKGIHEFYSKDFKVSVLEFDKPVSNDLHPTMKPISILMELITNSSKQKFIIYDPTLGSGSTLIACEQTKRKCYGMELDEYYCSVIITRWLNYMIKEGKEITLKCNGETIDYKEVLDDK